MFQVMNPLLDSYRLFFLNDKMRGKFFLYGHECLSIEENKAVLGGTLKFIHDSERFVLTND